MAAPTMPAPMMEPMPACEENEFFSTDFTPHFALPGFFPGAGGFFHGYANTRRRILIFGTDFGQLDYQQGLAATGGEPADNATIYNLTKVLRSAGVSLDDCFLTNAVLCAWRQDNCIGNHAVWRKFPTYIQDCAEWHRHFIERHNPSAVVLMGTPAVQTFGKVLYPELGAHWQGIKTLKAAYQSGARSFRCRVGQRYC